MREETGKELPTWSPWSIWLGKGGTLNDVAIDNSECNIKTLTCIVCNVLKGAHSSAHSLASSYGFFLSLLEQHSYVVF